MKDILTNKGFTSLYVGIVPRFYRNSIYGTLMLSSYNHIKAKVDKLFWIS
jgi:hypothetical protein